MDQISTNLLEPAMSYFNKEIYQINLILDGSLHEDYKKFLLSKKEYYIIASKLIERQFYENHK